MPTTVHIPPDLLEAVDKRARSLKISRNRFIVEALRRVIELQTGWSPAFIDALGDVGTEEAALVDDVVDAIHGARSSKAPPEL